MSPNRAAFPGSQILVFVLAVSGGVLFDLTANRGAIAQQPTRLEHDQIAAPPPVFGVTGLQITHRPDSEGGGELVSLHLSNGEVVGPFLKLPSLPQGVGYGTTEVGAPASATSPPCLRGHWARDAQFFYMCLSEPTASSGTRWRRLRWEPWP